jgi:hypothetical protein
MRRPAMQAQDKPSLYDRLGGVYNIAIVVDDFIDRIMVDPRLHGPLGEPPLPPGDGGPGGDTRAGSAGRAERHQLQPPPQATAYDSRRQMAEHGQQSPAQE